MLRLSGEKIIMQVEAGLMKI